MIGQKKKERKEKKKIFFLCSLGAKRKRKWCYIYTRASHVQLFWIFMLFQAVNIVKLNFKASLFSSTFQFEHSFLAKSQC